jgi:hypothetical protein
MVTVTTKEELEKALKNKENEIFVEGEMAKKIIRKQKVKKGALITGGASVLAGLALLPFTGGASTIAIAHGLTVGAVTISTTEVFVGAGLILSASSLLLLKNYTIEFESNKTENSRRVKLKLKPGNR